MKRTIVNRALAIAVAVLVTMTFTVMTADQAGAASKKTVYLPLEIKSTYNGGSEMWVEKYTYDKNGLVKSMTSGNGTHNSKAVYKRNSKGTITSVKNYTNGKLTGNTKNTLNKKGQVVKSVNTSKSEKTTYTGITTYKYYGNGKIKQSVFKTSSNPPTEATTSITNFRKDGTTKDYTYTSDRSSSKAVYDKKGRITKETNKFIYDNSTSTMESTYTYKTNKNGDTTKLVKSNKRIDSDGTVAKSTDTTTYKYKYDKHKNIIRQESKTVTVDTDGKTINSSSVMTCKYKAFKIDKKYANANDLVG